MTREEIIDFCEMKSQLEPENEDIFNYIIKALEQEQKTVQGKWIEERTYMECPNCHDIWHYEENQTERFKFCPTCGRRNK